MMSQKQVNLKIAERLKILHTRIKSVLIQIHYLKNTLLSDNGYFTKLCANPAYDQAIKLINRKFPNIEIKTNKAVLEPLIALKANILQELMFHYNTLADVLDIKDNLMDLLGQISAYQFSLDIRMNTDMTRLYLDLVADYSCIMFLLVELPQIRLILSIYNLAFVSKFDVDERVYPRLCERLVEKHKDGCIVELYNELNPYSRMLLSALSSVATLLPGKLASTSEWDEARTFQLNQNPSQGNTALSNLFTLLPLSRIHRWLFFGFLVVYPEILRTPTIAASFRMVLDVAVRISLFRDEVLVVHLYLTKFCASQKGLSKLATIVKESLKDITARTSGLHRARRTYLRLVMRHQLQVLLDQPGTIAPNLPTLCHTVSCAVDEVHWLVMQSGQTVSKKQTDDWLDPQLPEFLYQTEEIHHLVQQFGIAVVYYKKVLLEQDMPALQTFIDDLQSKLTEDHLNILTFFVEKINLLTVDAADNENKSSDEKLFKEVRLDWLRLQTFLSCSESVFSWMDNGPFVTLLNSLVLHTHFVDNLPKLLDKFSSLKHLFFQQAKLKDLFEANLKLAAQHRYAIVFPRLCSHFLAGCKQDCPEDYNLVLRGSTELAHGFLSRICQELCQQMSVIIKSQFELSLLSRPSNAVDLYHFHFQKRQKDGTDASNNSSKHGSTVTVDLTKLPGSESRRTNVEVSSAFDVELIPLSQLAVGLNSRLIFVNNRTLHPAHYLKKEIIKFLNDKFVSLSNIKFKKDKHDAVLGCRRTSDMKILINECLSVISRINEYVNINVSLIFMEVFLSQSLTRDHAGRTTLTETYCKWYLDFILQQPYSLHSPLLKCFVTITPSNQKEAANILLRCEEYTDIDELRALVDVIGPYGMRTLNEKIMLVIVKNVSVLRRFVQQNRAILIELNVLNLDCSKIKNLLQNLTEVDEFCQQWKQMGVMFAFKDLCREAVRDVTRKAMPFLKSTVDDLQQDLDTEQSDHLSSVSESDNVTQDAFKNQLIVNELCQGFGLKTKMDSTLFSALGSIRQQQQQIQAGQQNNIAQDEEMQNELLMVATSYLLPRLVGSNFYRVEYEAVEDNAHCAAYAIKELMYAFFSRFGDEKLLLEIRKFIGLTSSNLLRLGLETSTHSQGNKEEAMLINNRDSIYIFFDFVVQTLENVSDDFYEECFPYALVRQAYHNVVKQSRQVMTNAAHPTEASSKAALEASKIDVK